MRGTGLTRAVLVREPIWMNFTITPLFYTFEWVDACVDPEGRDRGLEPLENHVAIWSLEILIRTTSRSNWTRAPPPPLEKQMDPSDPIASRGRFLFTALCKYEVFRTSPRRNFLDPRMAQNIWTVTRDFQQCGILTSVDSDEPVQPPF